MNFVKTMMVSSALAAGLALAAAADPIKVANIKASADFGAVEGANAATFWPKLADDLKARTAVALQPWSAEEGWEVDIAIKDVSLNGVAALTGAGEFNRLLGNVTLRSPDGQRVEKFDLDVNAGAQMPTYAMPGAVLIAPSDADMYNTMIGAFADAVAQHVSKMNV